MKPQKKGFTKDEVIEEINGKANRKRAKAKLEIHKETEIEKQQVKLSDYYDCPSTLDAIFFMSASLSREEIIERLGNKSIVIEYKMKVK